MNSLISHAKEFEFDITRHRLQDWNSIVDEFNAEFEGKRIPGSEALQGKQTVAMLHCALVQNRREFIEWFARAEQKYLAEKEAVEK